MATLPTGRSSEPLDGARVIPTFPAGPAPDPAPVPGTPEAEAQKPRMRPVDEIRRTDAEVREAAIPAGLTAEQARTIAGRLRLGFGSAVVVRPSSALSLSLAAQAAWDNRVVEVAPNQDVLITGNAPHKGFACIVYRITGGPRRL